MNQWMLIDVQFVNVLVCLYLYIYRKKVSHPLKFVIRIREKKKKVE